MRRIANVHIIGASRWQRDHEIGIRVMRVKRVGEVINIIVQRQELAFRIRELQHGIQRGIQSARRDFGNNCRIGLTGELKYIPIPGLTNAPVDYDR